MSLTIFRTEEREREIDYLSFSYWTAGELSGCRRGRQSSQREWKWRKQKGREKKKRGENTMKRKRAKTTDGVRCNADPDTSPVKSLFTERPKWPNSNEHSPIPTRPTQPIIHVPLTEERGNFDVFRFQIYLSERIQRITRKSGKISRPSAEACRDDSQRVEFCGGHI